MIRIIFLMLSFVTMLFSSQEGFAQAQKIAVIVNHSAITIADVDDRMALILTSSNLTDSPDIRNKLAPQVMASLIDEQLRFQEAEKLGITIDDEEVAKGFAEIARQNNFTPAQFKSVLGQSGINPATMERQIRAQILWSKVVQKEIRPDIIVTDTDIDAYLQRLEANKGKTEYFISEIYLPVESADKEQDTRQLAERLRADINAGTVSFYKVAQQFSKAAGATQGGNIGWVQQGQLPEELDRVLGTMSKAQVSLPVRSLNGYHILLMRDFRVISDETIPARDQVMNILGTQRIERRQKRYLFDLKASAFIESRLGS